MIKKMNDSLAVLMALFSGIALGVLFFGGLWWTVQKGLYTKHPALLFSISLMLRTGVTLAGFIFVSQGNLERLAACLLGFFSARMAIMRVTKRALKKISPPEGEAHHGTES